MFNWKLDQLDLLKTKNMESGERPLSSVHSVPATAAAPSPNPASRTSLTPGPTSLGPALTTCGRLFRTASDQPFSMSSVSSAFPVVNHPAFGLYTTNSGRSEFGGLGSLGMSTALAAHPQLGAFPDWWRASEGHGRGGATFFPSLLGLPPIFSPPVQNHESGPFQSRTGSQNGRGSTKGLSGAVNGSSNVSVSSVSATPPTPATSEQSKEKPANKTKDKLRKKAAGISSESESGSSSDTSSDAVSSSDSEDLEEEDENDDEQSNESEDSDLGRERRVIEKVFPQSSTGRKKDAPKSVESKDPQEKKGSLSLVFPAEPPSSAHFPVPLTALPPPAQLLFQIPKQQVSVIQSTGMTTSAKPLTLVSQPGREASPKPLCLSASPRHPALSSSPKPRLSPSPKLKPATPSPKPPSLSPDGLKTSRRNFMEETFPVVNDFRLQLPFFAQEPLSAAHLKKQHDPYKPQKKGASSSLPPPKLTPEDLGTPKPAPPHSGHSNLFLSSTLLGNSRPNGIIQSGVQDAPLALITKPRSQGKAPDKPPTAALAPPFPAPVNLSLGAKGHPRGQIVPSHPSTSPTKSRTSVGPRARGGTQSHLARSLVDIFRRAETDVPSSKDSDDSVEDEDDEDDEDVEDVDEDSEDTPSERESTFGTDSIGSEDDVKDHMETGTDTESEKLTLLNLTKSSPVPPVSAEPSSDCSPLNLQIIKAPMVSLPTVPATSVSPACHSLPCTSFPTNSTPAPVRRKRVTDERELRIPLESGWRRETRIRNLNGRLQSNVAYYAPCGKKLRQYPDVVKYLSRNGITDITRDNFSFSAKIRIGDFYEARDGDQGVQWSLLKDEELLPRILVMEGRRGRLPNPDVPKSTDGSRSRRRKGRQPNVSESETSNEPSAKLLRKLEAQEIARQAAHLKLMRKLEKQALARAAKEARKQKAILAAEEKRKQKEQMKLLKQQEKLKRIQQIRMEKELRAQQVLEAKRKKKEEAANARILEAEKRIKEKEMRRQQAIILKHQELERHRLDMERERRRQHMLLLKAMEARKKAEERERLKQEKRDEKRLNKERRLEMRRLELEMAKELNKPNEDMCLADHKPLPDLSRIPGLVLPGRTFSDCLMVMQFLRSFGKVLGFDVNGDVPGLSVLQEGLLNVGESMGEVQDLLVRMLSAAVCDPGLPPGHRTKTALGDHLTNVGVNRDNVSEILQIYMEAHCGQTALAEVTESLKTKAFQALTPAQKASVLAFLANELACSKGVISEIDKNIDLMTNLRRDKWVIEGKLRKLRNIYAKKTGRRESCLGGEDTPNMGTPTANRKRKRKAGDTDEDDDDDEDSDTQAEDDDYDDEDGKKGKKVEMCEEEDEMDQTTSVEDLEKQIDKMAKQQSQNRRKLFEASHSLRSMMFGQDRYRRRYWVLPHCGGVFVEGMESGEGPEELEKELARLKEQKRAESMQIKEEPPDEKPVIHSQETSFHDKSSTPERNNRKDSTNLFLQKPSSFSKLSQLLEVAKMSPESEGHQPKPNSSPVAIAVETPASHTPPAPSPAAEVKPDLPGKTGSPQTLLANDQLFRALTEKSAHWFSLLPRVPCDETSLVTTHAESKSSNSSSPNQPASGFAASSHTPAGTNNFGVSAFQGKNGLPGVAIPFCGWPGGILSPNFASSLLATSFPTANGHHFLVPSVSTSKSESPAPPSEKPSSVPSPAVETDKPQDSPTPCAIPEDVMKGWWRVTDVDELRELVKALHSRGMREKVLQKQLQKYMESIAQSCSRNRDITMIDETDLEENQVTEETLETWCIEEQAMEMDISILQQVEELERKVCSASLQVKGWIYPEPQSEREDLIYLEHKPFPLPSVKRESDGSQERHAKDGCTIVRHVSNPLDIAVTRLAELEKNIERRYLKSPLSTTIQIKLDNVGTVTVPAPAPSNSGDGEGCTEDIAPGMKVWRRALGEVRSAAQLALCMQQLQKSIAWERSIMKVYCQICRKGDNEELLLLCDGCDKGCHTYCHRPKITTIPDGDWFCPACISKASGQTPKKKKLRTAVGNKRGGEVKRSRKLSVAGEGSGDDDAASTSSTPKKAKKRKGEEAPSPQQQHQDSPVSAKKARVANDNAKDLMLCSILLSELESHPDAWPFLTPVNPKSVPGYKKVIKKPMDFSTIREKLSNTQYQNLETFIIDVNLVFDNCEKFNEDNSDIGRAGHNMRKFFERRWIELVKAN